MIWIKCHNDGVFNAKITPRLSIKVITLAKEFVKVNLLRACSTISNHGVPSRVGWIKPNRNIFKINTDRVLLVEDSIGSVGGIIRDYKGNWVAGFAMNIGDCDIVAAELWAILQGLTLAWNLGIRSVIVETDSVMTVNMVNNDL